jgi:hypothetical protein
VLPASAVTFVDDTIVVCVGPGKDLQLALPLSSKLTIDGFLGSSSRFKLCLHLSYFLFQFYDHLGDLRGCVP